MSLKNILITGDCHGQVAGRMRVIQESMPEYKPEETAVIILGDVGFLYYLDSSDQRCKKRASEYGYTIYCVLGNHEARPSKDLGMRQINDEFVGGTVWIEDEFPLIRYFCEWGIYNILGRRTLVVGGAYSVDKHYRIQRGMKWFENEQLNEFERDICLRNASGYNPEFDLVLSHTCPYSLRPTDLFLNFIDQSTVDTSMEKWMEVLKDKIEFKIWLYGHYHADRIEAPYCEIFYFEVEDLKTIEARWDRYRKTGELDWWLPKSEKFYMFHKDKLE